MQSRQVFAFMTFLLLGTLYAMRVNLSVAIVAMVTISTEAEPNGTLNEEVCMQLQSATERFTENLTLSPNISNTRTVISEVLIHARTFTWNVRMQSAILGSFFIGYTVGQLPGGVLVQLFGGKWTLGIALLVASVFTVLTPVTADWSVVALMCLRALEGLVQGTVFPAINCLISNWIPSSGRSTYLSFIYSGLYIGSAVGFSLSGWLVESDIFSGWPSVFYVMGAFGCSVFVPWVLFIEENPQSDLHPNSLKVQNEGNQMSVPWLSILTSVYTWALNFAAIGFGWISYLLMLELPTYLHDILHFDIRENGALCAAPYVLQAIAGVLASALADRLCHSGKFTVTTVRKMMNSIAATGAAVCVLLVVFAECRSGVIIALLYLGMTLSGFAGPGYLTATIDVCPRYTGTLTGIVATFSNLCGFLAPLVAGEMTRKGKTRENWQNVFIVAASVSFICGLVFHLFGSAEDQSWIKEDEKSDTRTINKNKVHSNAAFCNEEIGRQ